MSERHDTVVDRLASAPDAWLRLMADCVMCERHCPGIALDRAAGVVPRAFTFGMPGEKLLAVIFGEPGGITARSGSPGTRELELYAEQQTPIDLMRAVDDFTYRCFSTGSWDGRPNPFHQRVTRLLWDVFGSVEIAMRSCYFSNLTKCEKGAPAIPLSTRSTCYDAWLDSEIRILRPRAALLFGGNAGSFAGSIQSLGVRALAADHPSARPPDWLREPRRSALLREIQTAIGIQAPERREGLPTTARTSEVSYQRLVSRPATKATFTERQTKFESVQPWIREYMTRLLSDPPPGTRTAFARNGRYPGVRINGGAIFLDLYAHEDYIRMGIHSADPRVTEATRSVPGFEVVKPARKWFTGYIRDRRGVAAVDLLLRGV